MVKLVNSTLYDALKMHASDIHLGTTGSGLVIKYRIDGVLNNISKIQGNEFAEQVISRVKVMAELDIGEKRVPQDGRFKIGISGRQIDFRVSIMPSIFGEDAVLRVLDKQDLADKVCGVQLQALGFEEDSLRQLRRLAAEPYGMVLVTGPTGSGKTTTLYAMITEINHGVDKIITIEDPVEYQLPGVLQIPVNEKKGLTFARGLRSILRHDPDKIMVGEIRDADTAQIAVQSALTGHLVFTTVHANNVFDVIGRFTHMDIDPYSLVSALNAVLAQRLIRLVRSSCSAPYAPTEEELRRWASTRKTSPLPLRPRQGLRPLPGHRLPRAQCDCRAAAPGRRAAADDRRAPTDFENQGPRLRTWFAPAARIGARTGGNKAGPLSRRSIVSLLSRERFVAVLGASGVGLGQRQGSDTLWLGSAGFIDEGFKAWTVALDTLDRLLGEHARAGAELTVVVSGHFSRFLPGALERADQQPRRTARVRPAVLRRPATGHQPTLEPGAVGRTCRLRPDRQRAAARPARAPARPGQWPRLAPAFGATVPDGGVQPLRQKPRRRRLPVRGRRTGAQRDAAGAEGRWTAVRLVGSSDSDAALSALVGRERQLQASTSERPLNVYLHAPARIDSHPEAPGVTPAHPRRRPDQRTRQPVRHVPGGGLTCAP